VQAEIRLILVLAFVTLYKTGDGSVYMIDMRLIVFTGLSQYYSGLCFSNTVPDRFGWILRKCYDWVFSQLIRL